MTSKCPSPNASSPSSSIFRPWQIKLDPDGENDHTTTITTDGDVNEDHSTTAQKLEACSSFHCFKKERLSNSSLSDQNDLIEESLVTSSTSFTEDDQNGEKNVKKSEGNGKKRLLEDAERITCAKRTRRNEQYRESTSSSSESPASILNFSTTVNTTTPVHLPIFPRIPQAQVDMHIQHPNLIATPSWCNSFIPILEPPILVPAAEVERVCARRPRPKRFTCGQCGAAFSNRGQLSGHCRIHTGERPFRCSEQGCGKRFTRNEELTRHRRIHSGLRPFVCTVCPKRFGRKDHLKKHLRTHTRHLLPSFPTLPPLNHLQQHLHQVQQLQHFQHLQQLKVHSPFLPQIYHQNIG